MITGKALEAHTNDGISSKLFDFYPSAHSDEIMERCQHEARMVMFMADALVRALNRFDARVNDVTVHFEGLPADPNAEHRTHSGVL